MKLRKRRSYNPKYQILCESDVTCAQDPKLRLDLKFAKLLKYVEHKSMQ